jgi:hypothetical protein
LDCPQTFTSSQTAAAVILLAAWPSISPVHVADLQPRLDALAVDKGDGQVGADHQPVVGGGGTGRVIQPLADLATQTRVQVDNAVHAVHQSKTLAG